MAFQMRDASALDSSRPLGSTGRKSLIAYLSSGRNLSNDEVPAVFPGEFQCGAASEVIETQTQILPQTSVEERATHKLPPSLSFEFCEEGFERKGRRY